MTDTVDTEVEEDVVETLVFTTKDKNHSDDDWKPDEFKFKLPDDPTDTTYVARKPKRATFLLLQAAFGRRARTADLLHEMFRFMDVALTDESARVLENRMDDADDPLEAEDVIDLMLTLIKRWGDTSSEPTSIKAARDRRR